LRRRIRESQPAAMITEAWDRYFRKHGQIVADWPVLTVAVSYILSLQCGLGWTRMGTMEGIGTRGLYSRVWTPSNLDVYPVLTAIEQEHTYGTYLDWSMASGSIAMWLPKDDYKNTDLVNRENFEEMHDVWKKWWSISVVTSMGNEYNAYDLCARNALPDAVGLPVFPCIAPSVIDCFREGGEHLHPSYSFLDAMGPAALLADPTLVSYALDKISFRTDPLTLKAHLSNCTSYTTLIPIPTGQTMPQSRVNAETGMLEAANMFFGFFLYDGMKRGAWRLKYAKSRQMTPAEREMDFREARDMHSRVLEHYFREREKTSEKFWYAMFRDYGYQCTLDINNGVKPELNLFLYGMVLIWLFQMTLVSCRYSKESRLQLSFFGNFLVILSMVCGLGLQLRVGIAMNPLIVAIVPFLSIGVGYDDVFVVMFGITEIDSAFFESNTTPVIMGELLSRVGRGVTLSTLCTAIAFLLGSNVPLSTISDFCMSVVMCAILNWFHMMTSFSVAVVCEINRMKQMLPEVICCPCQLGICCCCCPSCMSCSPNAKETKGDWAFGLQEKVLDFLYEMWAPVLAKWWVACIVLTAGLAAGGCAYIPLATLAAGIRQGYSCTGTYSDSVEGLMTYARSTAIIVTLADVDVASRQEDIMELFTNLTSSSWSTPIGTINYLSSFRNDVLDSPAVAPLNQLLIQTGNSMATLTNGASSNLDLDLKHGADMDAVIPGMGMTKRDLWYQIWHSFADWPEDGTDALDKFFVGDIGWLASDPLYVNEMVYKPHWNPMYAPFKFSHFQVSLILQDYDQLVEGIEGIEAVIDVARNGKFNPTEVFVSSTFYSVITAYGLLESIFWMLFFIDLGVIFLVCVLMLGSVVASLVCSICTSMVVLEVLGVSTLMIKFAPFSVVLGLAAMGIAVEDIAHITCAFIICPGTIKHRLGTAMRATFIPTVQGSFSTFLGLIPLLFSQTVWAKIYTLFPFCLIVIFGFSNGMLIAPSFCSVLSNAIAMLAKNNQAEKI